MSRATNPASDESTLFPECCLVAPPGLGLEPSKRVFKGLVVPITNAPARLYGAHVQISRLRRRARTCWRRARACWKLGARRCCATKTPVRSRTRRPWSLATGGSHFVSRLAVRWDVHSPQECAQEDARTACTSASSDSRELLARCALRALRPYGSLAGRCRVCGCRTHPPGASRLLLGPLDARACTDLAGGPANAVDCLSPSAHTLRLSPDAHHGIGMKPIVCASPCHCVGARG